MGCGLEGRGRQSGHPCGALGRAHLDGGTHPEHELQRQHPARDLRKVPLGRMGGRGVRRHVRARAARRALGRTIMDGRCECTSGRRQRPSGQRGRGHIWRHLGSRRANQAGRERPGRVHRRDHRSDCALRRKRVERAPESGGHAGRINVRGCRSRRRRRRVARGGDPDGQAGRAHHRRARVPERRFVGRVRACEGLRARGRRFRLERRPRERNHPHDHGCIRARPVRLRISCRGRLVYGHAAGRGGIPGQSITRPGPSRRSRSRFT